MEINNITLTKMKFLLNEEGVWVTKIQVGAYVEEEHDEEDYMLVVMTSLLTCLRSHL